MINTKLFTQLLIKLQGIILANNDHNHPTAHNGQIKRVRLITELLLNLSPNTQRHIAFTVIGP